MTAGAVMSYQQSRGQPQTGDIDRELLEQLRQDPAPQAAPPPPTRTAQRMRTQTAARHPGPFDRLGRWLDSLVR
jgi:peptidoglycan hydrolase-like protein with peptidoglycan-binding domain